jgi:hypothetical protein
MTHRFQALYDGECLRPRERLPIAPNTEVTLTYEGVEEQEPANPTSFFETARSIRVKGPRDWSERLDHYLYGGMADGDE